jgi:hypothetical protein
MFCWKYRYRYISILVHHTCADLVYVHIVTFWKVTLISVSIRASFDIDAIRLLEMLGHGLRALGTVYVREDRVRIPKSVVRM